MWWTVIAILPVLIWVYLLTGRGGFWRIGAPAKQSNRQTASNKSLLVVIPARNEAPLIGSTIDSLLAQDFPGPLHIVVVDDQSEDGTAESVWSAAKQAQRTANVTLLRGKPLPPGWTGKLWALSQGVAFAESNHPDYLLFTDADIHHSPKSLSELLGMAQAGNLDLASYMVKLRCETLAEKALIPAFVYFFFMLYPPTWVASLRSKTAGAAGGCVLLRAEALARIGGLSAIRSEIIDDCALARAVKKAGGKIWLGLTSTTHSTRSYGGFTDIGQMISRSAFSQLHHSAVLLAATAAGLFLTFLLPPILLLSKPISALLGATAWLMMSLSFRPMVRFYQRSPIWSFLLPVMALFYLAATLHSATQYWRGKGGQWKGRVQDTPAS